MSNGPLGDLLAGPPDIAAEGLVGCIVSTIIDDEVVGVRLNEVEAYGGQDDPASHAYRSRTVRNEPMWGAAGTLYVYLSYGIHWCANVVTGPIGHPSAVLLRGGTVVIGAALAAERRGRSEHLADGPGKLAQALGLDGSASGSRINVGLVTVAPPFGAVADIGRTPRIGISKAKEVLWRFVEGNPMGNSSSTIPKP